MLDSSLVRFYIVNDDFKHRFHSFDEAEAEACELYAILGYKPRVYAVYPCCKDIFI